MKLLFKKSKRVLSILAVCVAMLLLLGVSAFAQTEEGFMPSLDEIGAEELLEELPDEVENLLLSEDIDYSVADIVTMTPQKFFSVLKNSVTNAVGEPLRVIGTLAGIILVCGIVAGLKNTFLDGGLEDIFSVVAVLTVVSIVSSPIISLIMATGKGLQDCANFILCFIPVFSGVVTAGGQPVTAGTYTILLFSLCQIVAQIAVGILVPLMGIYFGLAIISAVFPDTPLKSLTSSIKNIVCWGLGLTTTVFVSLLSIQTLVSQGTDGVSIKTTKFLVGSFVPIVGGALSDALQTARGCIHFLKSTVGAFGIVVAVLTFLPLILRIGVWYFVTKIASEISGMMDSAELSSVLKAAAQTLSILIALLMCFALILVVSTTVVMMSGIA